MEPDCHLAEFYQELHGEDRDLRMLLKIECAHRRARKLLTDYNHRILTFHSIYDYFALLKALSCIEFLDYVYSLLDSKQSTIAVYLDFSKAFDNVNHNILMSKLLRNGVRGVMQRWCESCLSNRKQ